MIVYHSAWDPESGRLHLWAEYSESYQGSYRRVILAGKGKAPVHPFSLGRAALSQHTSAFASPEIISRGISSTLHLRLPTGARGPLPSAELKVKAYTSVEGHSIKTWQVGTLALQASDALHFFESLVEAPRDASFGASFLFAAEIASCARTQGILRGKALLSLKEKMPDFFKALLIPPGAERLRPEFLIEDFFEQILSHPHDTRSLVFQLDPSENSGEWKIRFLLQPFKDRSLFVPAENIWRKKNEKMSVDFFTQLRAAAAVCSLLAPALSNELPGGLCWTEEQVYLFCNRDEARLKREGFEIVYSAGKPEMPEPPGFSGELRPYQRYGVSWMRFLESRGQGILLADDMGLGKTVQIIALVAAGIGVRALEPTLIVCPVSVAGNWKKEFACFAPGLKVALHHGSGRFSGDAFNAEVCKFDVIITTYSLVWRDVENLGGFPWARVILDEAQNIKNPQSLQAKAVKKIKAASRIALTGTPVENRLSELGSILDFLNPGMFGPAAGFERKYEKNEGELYEKIAPVFLRRLKTDKSVIRDLPEKMEMKVFCSLTPEQAGLYVKFTSDHLDKIQGLEGLERKGQILTALTRIKQICNHPDHFLKPGDGPGSNFENRSGKLARLTEMLEETVSEGDKALVFTQFAEMGKLLLACLSEKLPCPVFFLHGGTPAWERERLVAEFQSSGPGPAIFILSLKAGGTGLNLTAANQVFHYDRWWNPAVENQATDRAFRIGQARNVLVYKLVTLGTMEERIDRMLESKRELADRVLGSGEDWITEMSDHELRDFLFFDGTA